MHKQAKRRLPVARLHSFLACVLCKTGVVHGTNRMNNIRLAQLNSYKQERAPLDYSSLIMGQLEIIKSVSSVMDATCVKDSSVVAENPTMLTLLDASSVLTINQHTNAPVRVRKSWKQVLQRHPPKKSVRFKLLTNKQHHSQFESNPNMDWIGPCLLRRRLCVPREWICLLVLVVHGAPNERSPVIP